VRDEKLSEETISVPHTPARVGSPQIRAFPWSYAVATFNLRCAGSRPIELVASLERLPTAFDYEWVVVTGDAGEFVSLTSRRDIRSAVTGARGDTTKFAPTPSTELPAFGTARALFEFRPAATTRVDQLTLVVKGVSRERAYVLSAPRARCI
jgi:hypothetical protein